MKLQIFSECHCILNTVCLWTFPKSNKHWNDTVIAVWLISGIMFTQEQITKAQRASRVIAVLFLQPRR